MHTRRFSFVPAALLAALSSFPCLAQSARPAIFVANNGNLEGSVSSFIVEADGSLTFTDRVVTGSRSGISQPCPGCNTYAIDISPDGRFLATCHAAGDAAENFTVYAVAPDATLSVVETLTLPQGGLDAAWVRDDLLAVCITDIGGPNELRLYHWDADAAQLTLADTDSAGSFLTSLAVHPTGRWVLCNDSFGDRIRVFEIDADQAALVQNLPIGVYGTSLAFSPGGDFAYASGGISAGGHAFAGFSFDDSSGTLTQLPGSPFTSPGQSPKGFAFSPDGSLLFVSHGTDATIRSFSLDQSGIPTSLGTSFDVGTQGTLQGMDTLDGLLLAMDSSDGAFSFGVDPVTGALIPVAGSPVPTQGISPNDVAAWSAQSACVADFTGDGKLNFFDVSAFVNAFAAHDPAADLTGEGAFDFFDVSAFINAYTMGCP